MEETSQRLLVLFFWEITVMHFFFLDNCYKDLHKSGTFILLFFLILFLRFCLGRSSFKNSLLFDCKLDVSQLNFWIWKKMQHQLLWNYNGMKPSKHSLKGHLTSSKIRWGVNHWNTKCGFEMKYLILESWNLRQRGNLTTPAQYFDDGRSSTISKVLCLI